MSDQEDAQENDESQSLNEKNEDGIYKNEDVDQQNKDEVKNSDDDDQQDEDENQQNEDEDSDYGPCDNENDSTEITTIALDVHRPFVPIEYGLRRDFKLTNYALMFSAEDGSHDWYKLYFSNSIKGSEGNDSSPVGLNCAVTKLHHDNLLLVQSTTLIYPLVDEPYMMGKISCAHLLNVMYAAGINKCDVITITLGVSTRMSIKENNTITHLVSAGIVECARTAGIEHVNFEREIINPLYFISGTSSVICPAYDIPNNACMNDVLVLTKPLGTNIIMNLYQWINDIHTWKYIEMRTQGRITKEDIKKAYHHTMESMARLNLVACNLMYKHNVHAACDVADLGILGHAKKLVTRQQASLDFLVHSLPIYEKMASCAAVYREQFKFFHGICPETSGGLLICMTRLDGMRFCREIYELEGHRAWIVGIVENGKRSARLIERPQIIHVTGG